ncbi:hypothetical protein BVC80_8681g15 [Macleaya cordata]|uniref:Uncharacterized protein n=1 Tax=Macleaya cordata TaxID=56857 RepID=A0A200QLA7_MACCD|nr:hypothetical protein BVC80_8681g15 [Macleaya cordata]
MIGAAVGDYKSRSRTHLLTSLLGFAVPVHPPSFDLPDPTIPRFPTPPFTSISNPDPRPLSSDSAEYKLTL